MDNVKFVNFLLENTEASFNRTKFMNNLNEEQMPVVSDQLVTQLYKNMIEKYNYIDFGHIPESKGDIERFKDYKVVEQSLDLLNQIKTGSGITSLPELDTLNNTLRILKEHKKEFSTGFIQEKNVIIVLYNTMVASLIAGINLIITSMVEYIRTPNGSIEAIIQNNKTNKSMEYMLIDNLVKFNSFAEKGDLKKFFNMNLHSEKFVGAIAAPTIIATMILIVPIMRECIYYIMNTRMSVSEYIKMQSEFIDSNVEVLKLNDVKIASGSKKNVIKNQEKISGKLKGISDKIRLKFDNAENNTKKEISKKVKIDNIENSFNFDSGSFLV